jgi:mannose-6-phosphate isomerase-like protein (cupin superfamily)
MSLDSENAALVREESGGKGFVITRARDAMPHLPKKQRGVDEQGLPLHPAIERGMRQMREQADAGGATALTLFSMPTLHVSYVWFRSGYPLPLHSHDADCYYLVTAGSMKVGSEELRKGDGVLIPGGAPYTVTPGQEGVEFLEMRTADDYDTHFRAKTDAYWDRIAETRAAR